MDKNDKREQNGREGTVKTSDNRMAKRELKGQENRVHDESRKGQEVQDEPEWTRGRMDGGGHNGKEETG